MEKSPAYLRAERKKYFKKVFGRVSEANLIGQTPLEDTAIGRIPFMACGEAKSLLCLNLCFICV